MSEADDGYRVLFVSERNPIHFIEPGTIAISPSSDRWNDFGERILIELIIQPRHNVEFLREPLKLRGFFGFLEKQNGKFDTLYLRELVDENSETPVPVGKVPAYFTMLPDMESYRRLVGQLGPDEARLALRAINDMVEADDRPFGQPWMKMARESQIFLNAFLRHSEPFFAWKNAAPILLGVEYEELDRISEGVRIQFQLGSGLIAAARR